MNGPSSSVGVRTICDNKWLSRELFAANGLAVARSGRFVRNDVSAALTFAREKIGYPVVVKPNSASRGLGVSTNITNDDAFRIAWQAALAASRAPLILVERQVGGHDYRFFVSDGQVASVTRRRRASVTGNGRSTVLQLIHAKNTQRAANVYLASYPIPEDTDRLEAFTRSNREMEHVPADGEHVELRDVSNLSSGGDSIDMTEQADPSFHAVAVTAIKACPGMRYGGVDIIAEDITAPARSLNHVVGEIEFSPAPLAHFPWSGTPRNMAGAIIDAYSR